MRATILAFEDAEPALSLDQSEQEAAAQEDDIQMLEDQAVGLDTSLASADEANETVTVMSQMASAFDPEEGQPELTEGGSAAVSAALEHLLLTVGIKAPEASKIVALEGLSPEQRIKKLSIAQEGVFDVVKRIGQAIWRILQKIADWMVSLYQKFTLSISRMKRRLAAVKAEAAKQHNHTGGWPVKGITLRNFFNYRGKDYGDQDIPAALSKNTQGCEKLWGKVETAGAKAITAIEYLIDKPTTSFLGGTFGDRVNDKRTQESGELLNAFALELFSTVINNSSFSSDRVADGEAYFVTNKLHMPFGNYVMSFTMLDINSPSMKPEVAGRAYNSVKSRFGFEPPERESQREQLLSMSSRDINATIHALEHDLAVVERVSRQAKQIQAKVSLLSNKAMSEGWTRLTWGDRKAAQSMGIAMGVASILSNYARGPIGGLSLYMLKSEHYALRLVEKSLKLNAQGEAPVGPIAVLDQLRLTAA